MPDFTHVSPLRQIRRARGLSLAEVARKVGAQTGNLSRIETGHQSLSRDLAARLAALFAPDIDERHIIYPERYADWSPSKTASSKASR
jgi:transcriptional regulator with XRE-family HTH domain